MMTLRAGSSHGHFQHPGPFLHHNHSLLIDLSSCLEEIHQKWSISHRRLSIGHECLGMVLNLLEMASLDTSAYPCEVVGLSILVEV